MIHLATDHAGYELKEKIKIYLAGLGYETKDHGAHSFDDKDDYPDFIKLAAEAVSKNPETEKAIIFGGSGQGEAMVANRFSDVRAAVCYGGECADQIVVVSRDHNNSNILSIGARFIGDDEVRHLVSLWLNTAFSGEERHKRRIKKIDIK